MSNKYVYTKKLQGRLARLERLILQQQHRTLLTCCCLVAFCHYYYYYEYYHFQHKGESVAVVAKALGQLWNALPENEKQVFQQKAAAERAQVQAELKARDGLLPQAPEAASSNKKATDPCALAFPLARIRKIVKLDPEVSVINKQALAAVTKATELFVEKLGLETVRVASVQNRRKLLPEDVVMVCETKDVFAFLRDDLQDLVAAQQQSTTQEQQQQQQQQQQAAAGTKRKATEVASQSNKLTSYFAVKPKDASS